MGMQNSEQVKKIAGALEKLESDFELSTDVFPWDEFEESPESVSIDEDEEIYLTLPRVHDEYHVKYEQLFELLDELDSAELIDNVECITNRRFLTRVQPVFSETQAEFYSAMEHIENQDDGAFKMQLSEEGTHYSCRIVDGFTLFGVMVAKAGKYDKYFPPVSHDDIFVEVEFSGGSPVVEKARQIFQAYVFELSASMSFDIAPSPRPEFDSFDDEMPKVAINEKFRPLLVGKGLEEPLSLYNKAVESTSYDISILYFSKVIEFVSQTAIRINLTEKVRSKLLSARALDPDAEYIKELGELYDANRVYKKDADAMKLAISTCCDATELSPYIPKSIALKWKKQLENGNSEKALQELAFCITSTRNRIAHAKANYESTGAEVEQSEYLELSKCMKVCSQQAIRWYASRHESQRIW
jgi:hypothetical protein